jgi:cell division protein FtsW (lipid II flippase)
VFAFLFQVFVNVGMTIGIGPITEIPLPFVSVGGSSMIRTSRDRILSPSRPEV